MGHRCLQEFDQGARDVAVRRHGDDAARAQDRLAEIETVGAREVHDRSRGRLEVIEQVFQLVLVRSGGGAENVERLALERVLIRERLVGVPAEQALADRVDQNPGHMPARQGRRRQSMS